jgi:hypothetical protein
VVQNYAYEGNCMSFQLERQSDRLTYGAPFVSEIMTYCDAIISLSSSSTSQERKYSPIRPSFLSAERCRRGKAPGTHSAAGRRIALLDRNMIRDCRAMINKWNSPVEPTNRIVKGGLFHSLFHRLLRHHFKISFREFQSCRIDWPVLCLRTAAFG